MDLKSKVISTMQELEKEVSKHHKNSKTTEYITQTLGELKKNEGVAFTGTLQLFFNTAPIIKMSDAFSFNETESTLWNQLFSYNQLGNNLWGATL